LTATIDLLWEALRYARLAEPPVAAGLNLRAERQ